VPLPEGDDREEGGSDFCFVVNVLAHAKTANRHDKNA
jgi:hypothetical protein